jgi:hypothetical protein
VLHFLHKPSLEAHSIFVATPQQLKPSIPDLTALGQWRRFSVDPSGCDEMQTMKNHEKKKEKRQGSKAPAP